MSGSRPEALIVGKNAPLLLVREMIVTRAGASAISAHDVNEAASILENAQPCAVVLCHTLTGEERENIEALVAVLTPSASVLEIALGCTQPSEVYDFAVDAVRRARNADC